MISIQFQRTATPQTFDWTEMPALPVDRFFGIACPITLNDDTAFTRLARVRGDEAMETLSNKAHVTSGDYLAGLIPNLPIIYFDDILDFGAINFLASSRISYSLMDFYNDLAVDEESTTDFSSFNASELYFFNGFPTDVILHVEDQNRSISSIDVPLEEGLNYSGNANAVSFFQFMHTAIKNQEIVKNNIREVLR